MNFNDIDIHHMKSALNLARHGLGRTAPNPTVGCVIVKGKRVIARARTADGGRPHAEYLALQQGGGETKGATVYVTLEPCAHEGKTPSCARLLVGAGIKKCMISIRDSDPRTAGQGISMLREAGVQVVEGVLEEEGYDLNLGFFLRQAENRPFISLKTATTLDAKVAMATGESQWITGAQARRRTHLIRAQHDAIAVGVNTVLSDNPLLTSRIEKNGKKMVRIIFDTDLRLTGKEKIFEDMEQNPVWIVTTSEAQFVHDAVQIIRTPRRDLKSAMHEIASRGVTRLMIEGGATFLTSFINEKLYDQLYWFRADKLIGADGLNAVQDLEVQSLDQAVNLDQMSIMICGDDILSVYKRATR